MTWGYWGTQKKDLQISASIPFVGAPLQNRNDQIAAEQAGQDQQSLLDPNWCEG